MQTLANAVDRAEMTTRLANIRPGSRRRWGRMAPGQMICHLSDTFRGALGDRAPGNYDPSLLQRTLLKWIALYAPITWPRGVRSTREADQDRGGTRPTTFERDHAELMVLFGHFCDMPHDRRWFHGVFGLMSRSERLRWGWLHTDHHLRQFGE